MDNNTRRVTARTDWTSLIKLTLEGTQYVTNKQAAQYLGMHEKSFIRLCRDNGITADHVWGTHPLYTRATLDSMDHQRGKPGRPPKASDSSDSS